MTFHSDDEYYVTLDSTMTKILSAHKVPSTARLIGKRKGASYIATGWKDHAPIENEDIKLLHYKDWKIFVDLRTMTDICGNPIPKGDPEWKVVAVHEVSSWCKIVTNIMTVRPGLQVLRDVIYIRANAGDAWTADNITHVVVRH